MLNENRIPEGYMENAQGCLVPRANIRPIDIERDALVKEKMEKIKALQAEMRAVKASLLSDVDAFVQLSGERYGVRLGGVKGNVQLLSFDGKYKLCRDYGQLLTFDEGSPWPACAVSPWWPSLCLPFPWGCSHARRLEKMGHGLS